MNKRNPYAVALNDIALALRGKKRDEVTAWNVELLPGQVERELTRLRFDNERLSQKVARLEAERELWELAVKAAALEKIAAIHETRMDSEIRLDSEVASAWEGVFSALSSDSGRMAGELIRAADRYIEASRDIERGNTAEWGALVAAHAALLARFPGMREEVGRGG